MDMIGTLLRYIEVLGLACVAALATFITITLIVLLIRKLIEILRGGE